MKHSGEAPLQIDKSEKAVPESLDDYKAIAVSAIKSADEFLHIADPYAGLQDISLSFNIAFCANMMFACELYIKALLFYNQIKFGKEHSLKNLFVLLPNSVQNDIINECRKVDNFEMQLNEVSKAFEVFRYAYEYTCLAYDFIFMAMLECALYTIAHRDIKVGQ